VNKTVYIGDDHLKRNIHAGTEKHLLQLLLKSPVLTFKETANTKTTTNRNFTVKAYSTYTLTKTPTSSRISLTTALQQFQTINMCNFSPTQQPDTPTEDHKSHLEDSSEKKSPWLHVTPALAPTRYHVPWLPAFPKCVLFRSSWKSHLWCYRHIWTGYHGIYRQDKPFHTIRSLCRRCWAAVSDSMRVYNPVWG